VGDCGCVGSGASSFGSPSGSNCWASVGGGVHTGGVTFRDTKERTFLILIAPGLYLIYYIFIFGRDTPKSK
jgi:hypothetical protein